MLKTEKTTGKILIALFVLLLAGSLFYYKQRMLFIDPAWVVFNIINTKSFLFAEYRYGAFITQMIPLAGTYLGLPLKTILVAYSASFAAFYLSALAIVVLKYRQIALGILMAFYFTLFVSDEFFWPNNEVHQGIAWMFLFLGLFNYNARHNKKYHHFFLPVFGFLAIFSHFIVIIPFSFLWLYYFTDKRKDFDNKVFLLYTLYLAIVFFIKYKLGVKGWYDGAKLEHVAHIGPKDIIRSFSNGHARSIIPLFLTNYWVVMLLFFAGIWSTFKNKHYRLTILSIGYALGYFSLLCLTYPDAFGRNTLFYMESEWMALSIIAGAVFVFKISPLLKTQYVNLILIAVFSVRVAYMLFAAPLFEHRLNATEKVLAAMKHQKINKALVIKDENTDNDFVMDWGAPVESLFLSAMEEDQPQLTFKIMPGQDIKPTTADTFESCFNRVAYAALNEQYFKIDTTQVYKIIRYEAIR